MSRHPPTSDPTTPSDSAANPSGRRFRFGNCALDTRTLELTVGGAVVRLERRPLELLLYLLTHAGEVVTKDELLDEVWEGRVVSESVLTKCVAKLRQGLGDEDQAIVRTVHGYGYRLVAEVRVERPATAPVRLLPELKPGDRPPLRPLWRLAKPLGSGGFGEAWLVEHAKTGEQRVFKFGVDAAGLSTLRREITLHRVLRQALGPRPDFVRILDWNLEEPPCYLEIEYVEGGSLADWLTAAGGPTTVPLETRLDLVIQVAEALAAAHSVGVLHKDLKPGNILVAASEQGRPQVKLCDFGSGHLTDLARLEQLEITRLGFTEVRPDEKSSGGTPLYLAPELLQGHAPTAHSDLYALGVLLYQLVIGDLRKPLAVGWEQDVTDPLLREDIAAAAAGRPQNRLGDAAALATRLRQLDERRRQLVAEESAQAEAQRLKAALDRAQRRRRGLALASGVLGAMLAVTIMLLLQVREAREQARYEAEVAAAVNEFLTTDLLAQANPMLTGRSNVTMRELLDTAADSVGMRFAGRPGAEAGVRLALGSSYRNLGEWQKAQRELERVIVLGEQAPLGAGKAALARLELGRLLTSQDLPAEVIGTVDELLDQPDPEIRLQARIITGWARQHLGEYEQALSELQAVMPEVESYYGAGSAEAAMVLGYQAATLEKMSRYADANALHRRELAALQALYGEGDVRTLLALRGLASSLFMTGGFEEGLGYTSAAHSIALEVLGPEHENTLKLASDLALFHKELGDRALAERILLETLEVRLRLFGEQARDTRSLLNNIGLFYGEQGDSQRELEFTRRAWHAERAASGERDPFVLVAAHNHARALNHAGRLREAEALERETIALTIESLGAEHAYVGIMQYTLADILGRQGVHVEAEALFAAALELLDATVGADNIYSQRVIELRDEMRGRLADASLATSD
jgi:eukaryotic-like serine/threonine-protein kinase